MSRNLIPRRDDFFAPVQQVFDDFFSDFFRSNPLDRIKGSGGFPKMDVYEDDGKFVVSLAASGMTAKDLSVEVRPDTSYRLDAPDTVLVIKGRMAEEYRTPDKAQHYLRELRASAFERQLRLPDHVKGDPKAVMKDGILTLTWQIEPIKKEPEVKKIAIETE